MQYTLLNTLLNQIVYTHNADGTITVTGLGVQVGIVGAPAGKFIQSETIPSSGSNAFPVIIPATTAASAIPAFLQTEAQAYVTKVYPNS